MAVLSLLLVLVQSLIQYPQPAGDGLDEATHWRMQERQELLDREMARLLQELEQGPLEQQDEGWGALLFGALQQWPFWLLVGVLLLLGLWFSCRRRSSEANSSSKDWSSCETLRDRRGEDQEDDSGDSKEGEENIDVSVETDDSGREGSDQEGSPVYANEADAGDAIEGDDDVKVDEDNDDKDEYGYDLKKGNSVDSKEGGENVDLTVEADDSLPPRSDEGSDREGSPVPANEADAGDAIEGDDDVKVDEDNDDKDEYGYDLKKGNSVDSKEGGENVDLTVEADDSLPPRSDEGSDREGSPVPANDGGNDDVIEGTDDVKMEEDSDVKSVSGHDLKNAEGWSDGNVPGDNTAEGNEEEPGSVAGNTEVLNDANEGEDKDVQVEEDKDFGKEEEGNGSEEKTRHDDMKAGNNDDVDEGEDNVDGKEEYMVVKVQESSDASEQRSSVCTDQEDSSVEGKEADRGGFPGTEEEKREIIKEGDNARNKDEDQGGVNVDGNKNENRKEDKQGNVAASAKEGSDGGYEERGCARHEEGDVGNKRGILLADRIEWPVQDVERGCSVIAELMKSLTRVFVDSVSNSFYPVPRDAIGVGSAFEGWTPRDWDGVYRVLVPLNPPPGHAFQLELDSAGQMAARTFRVHVELVCTCRREQPGEKLLCFLHHSQKKLRRKHKRSLLQTLCTGCYLDVEKTSHWFCQLVRSSWLHVPQSNSWHLVFQPCSRSCQFQLSKGRKSLTVEILFGVCQGDSDVFVVSQPPEAQKGGSSIFVSSQPSEAHFPASTVWPETYAVAEAKFLWHMGTQLPSEGLHLKCLQVFTCILRGTGFSSTVWKTVVMHMLTTVPLCRWRSREFERRLRDIMAFLRRCLQSKRLEHFVLGTERLPAEISLPLAKPRVEPLNLFEHLARDPAAHRKAMQAYGQLRFRLWMLLSNI